jgi:hypothetical protein
MAFPIYSAFRTASGEHTLAPFAMIFVIRGQEFVFLATLECANLTFMPHGISITLDTHHI